MDKIYSALDVAAYCINRCIDKERPVSNLQLQKILYYVQANFLCRKNMACFRENIKNWQYGPVVEEVYKEYKKNAASPIRTKVEQRIKLGFIDGEIKEIKENLGMIDADDINLIYEVCDVFSHYSGSKLIEKTHQEDPWKNTKYNEIISNASIEYYFKTHQDRLC